ncbi:MAG: hypothetical protein M3430_14650 [Acidobacteriota bacterium]|nr:hypothetical protein [Acidobacteriota bacterium]
MPINCAGRLALWTYPRIAVSRFQNAPPVVETTRSYERPDFDSLPEACEVVVELWGGAVSLRLDGERRRVYTERFEYVTFTTECDARAAFLGLWGRLERLESVAEVTKTISAWLAINGG